MICIDRLRYIEKIYKRHSLDNNTTTPTNTADEKNTPGGKPLGQKSPVEGNLTARKVQEGENLHKQEKERGASTTRDRIIRDRIIIEENGSDVKRGLI